MSLDTRRDNRTVEQFRENIRIGHMIEAAWADVLSVDFSTKQKCNVSFTDNGVDNSGDVIFDSQGVDFTTPDFVFHYPNEDKITEIKTAPEYLNKYYTFKACCFKTAVKLQSRVILCRLGYYDEFSPVAAEWMLNNLKTTTYRNFSPNDPAVRIGQQIVERDYYKTSPYYDEKSSSMLSVMDLIDKGIIQRHKWCKPALECILKHKDLLVPSSDR